jgi:diacylglycerol kinase family enzyme
MNETTRSTILFVINPASGGKAKTDWESAIRDFFKSTPYHIQVYLLDGKNDPTSIRVWIEKIKPGRVVAVGGDGTVTLLAKELLGSDVALGILPAGSANGMARELGLPLTVNEALQVIEAGQTKQADVIRINDEHISLHLSDIGLNARLIKHFEEGKLRGKFGYATKVIKTLWTKSYMTVEVCIGAERATLKALMVVLANATSRHQPGRQPFRRAV